VAWLHRHTAALAFAIALACYVSIYASGLQHEPIRSDVVSYWIYLPATLIHHDPSLETDLRVSRTFGDRELGVQMGQVQLF
jgi:hypothetical protein